MRGMATTLYDPPVWTIDLTDGEDAETLTFDDLDL